MAPLDATDRVAAVRRAFARHSNAFEYGTNDCCQLVLDVVREIRGEQCIDAPIYIGSDGAARVIAAYGGIDTMVTQLLGAPPTTNSPRDGDICMVDLRELGMAMAVWCSGNPVVISTHGFVRLPPKAAVYSWSVD